MICFSPSNRSIVCFIHFPAMSKGSSSGWCATTADHRELTSPSDIFVGIYIYTPYIYIYNMFVFSVMYLTVTDPQIKLV